VRRSGSCILGFGANDAGQLALGHDRSTRVPQLVEGVPAFLNTAPSAGNASAQVGPPIAAISAGGFHSLLLDLQGSVFSVGENFRGQQGTGWGALGSIIPQLLHLDADGQALPPVRGVAAGTSHSLLVTTDGLVFSFGEGCDGRLGLTKMDKSGCVARPKRVTTFLSAVWRRRRPLGLTRDGVPANTACFPRDALDLAMSQVWEEGSAGRVRVARWRDDPRECLNHIAQHREHLANFARHNHPEAASSLEEEGEGESEVQGESEGEGEDEGVSGGGGLGIGKGDEGRGEADGVGARRGQKNKYGPGLVRQSDSKRNGQAQEQDKQRSLAQEQDRQRSKTQAVQATAQVQTHGKGLGNKHAKEQGKEQVKAHARKHVAAQGTQHVPEVKAHVPPVKAHGTQHNTPYATPLGTKQGNKQGKEHGKEREPDTPWGDYSTWGPLAEEKARRQRILGQLRRPWEAWNATVLDLMELLLMYKEDELERKQKNCEALEQAHMEAEIEKLVRKDKSLLRSFSTALSRISKRIEGGGVNSSWCLEPGAVPEGKIVDGDEELGELRGAGTDTDERSLTVGEGGEVEVGGGGEGGGGDGGQVGGTGEGDKEGDDVELDAEQDVEQQLRMITGQPIKVSLLA
jgi:hypothetical protein